MKFHWDHLGWLDLVKPMLLLLILLGRSRVTDLHAWIALASSRAIFADPLTLLSLCMGESCAIASSDDG